MTLYQIVSYLKQIALSSPYIRTAEEGSVYTIMNGNPHSKYGVFVVSQTLHRQDEIFDYYGLNLFVIDRLVDDLESNRLQIQSLAKEVLANTILTFVTKFYGITHNELQFHPFTEKFVDLTAGQYVQVTFQVPKNLICPDDYNLDFYDKYRLLPLNVEITDNGIYEYTPVSEDYDGYDSVKITVNVPTGATINNQTKTVEVVENGDYVVEFDEGYTGLDKVNLNVDVSGYTEQDLNDAYESGITSGVTYQKSLIISLNVDKNGVYSTENGYSPVTVNIDTDAYYNSGYTGGYESGTTDGFESGVTYQKSLLSAITITHNGEYTNENGYSAITVEVPQTGESINNQTKSVEYSGNGEYTVSYDNEYTGLETVNITVNVPQSAYTSGYTQEDLDNAYESGITHQKGLLSAATFTSNGTYTRVNGYSAVTVNVQSDISYYLLIVNFANNEDLSELVHNVVVTVTNNSGSTNYTYDGINLRINLLPGVSYTISYSSLAGRTTPSSDSLTTVWGGGTTLYPVWEKIIAETLTVTPSTYSFEYTGGNTTLTVQSNNGWEVTSKPNWLTLSTSSGGSGTTTITATVNSTSSFRSGTTVFKSTNRTVTENVEIKEREDYKPKGNKGDYLTVSAITSGRLHFVSNNGRVAQFRYSINGEGWQNGYSGTYPSPYITLSAGDIVRFKGEICLQTDCTYDNMLIFTGKNGLKYNLIGNIMSLIDGMDPHSSFSGLTDISSYEGVFWYMFSGLHNDLDCGIVNASGLYLPATTLSNNCYRCLFSNQELLVSTPTLPATTLTENCYYAMFRSCSSLEIAPELPASTLVTGCYYNMFEDCENLRQIKSLATNVNATDCTTDWVKKVKSSGTFIKKSTMSNWPTGNNGIPSNWTVQNV